MELFLNYIYNYIIEKQHWTMNTLFFITVSCEGHSLWDLGHGGLGSKVSLGPSGYKTWNLRVKNCILKKCKNTGQILYEIGEVWIFPFWGQRMWHVFMFKVWAKRLYWILRNHSLRGTITWNAALLSSNSFDIWQIRYVQCSIYIGTHM